MSSLSAQAVATPKEPKSWPPTQDDGKVREKVSGLSNIKISTDGSYSTAMREIEGKTGKKLMRDPSPFFMRFPFGPHVTEGHYAEGTLLGEPIIATGGYHAAANSLNPFMSISQGRYGKHFDETSNMFNCRHVSGVKLGENHVAACRGADGKNYLIQGPGTLVSAQPSALLGVVDKTNAPGKCQFFTPNGADSHLFTIFVPVGQVAVFQVGNEHKTLPAGSHVMDSPDTSLVKVVDTREHQVSLAVDTKVKGNIDLKLQIAVKGHITDPVTFADKASNYKGFEELVAGELKSLVMGATANISVIERTGAVGAIDTSREEPPSLQSQLNQAITNDSVMTSLRDRMEGFGAKLTDVSITGFDFSNSEFREALNAASASAARGDMEIKTATNDADLAMIKARTKAGVAAVNAQSAADTAKILSESDVEVAKKGSHPAAAAIERIRMADGGSTQRRLVVNTSDYSNSTRP